MQAFLSFLKSRQFFIHLGLILALVVLIFLGIIKWLSSYTHHGEYVEVPEFKGQNTAQLNAFVQNKEVSYQIIDSIYDPREKPGVVLRQDPEAGSKVKHNRTVYLYVTGKVAPQIAMPKLVDRSERQARLILLQYGLRVGKITERNADCNGCVLAQLSKGQTVEAGAGVQKGSVIDLVVGKKDNFYNAGASDTSSTDSQPDFDAE